MNLRVIEKHDGYKEFPLFKKGAVVNNLKTDDEFPASAELIWGDGSVQHWLSCTIDGHEFYVPDIYVIDGVLARDYNPTELIVQKNQIVTLIDLVFEWVYVKDEAGQHGWLPASKVISIGENI